ncbi:MAG TPA: hypothetical protein VJN88_12380 [Ktedonobacterales bacterium]|nr:hypothetical protein [Ktedonobacterales bacterium]
MSEQRQRGQPGVSGARRAPAIALGVVVALCVLIGVVLFAVGMAQMR